jgi:hypothetical protein
MARSSAGKRQSKRTKSVVPVRLWIARSKNSHLAHTLDVSNHGVQLGGYRGEMKVGDEIVIPKLCRCFAERSMCSVHRSIEGYSQLIENTGLDVHRILCIAFAHQRCGAKCGGLSLCKGQRLVFALR